MYRERRLSVLSVLFASREDSKEKGISLHDKRVKVASDRSNLTNHLIKNRLKQNSPRVSRNYVKHPARVSSSASELRRSRSVFLKPIGSGQGKIKPFITITIIMIITIIEMTNATRTFRLCELHISIWAVRPCGWEGLFQGSRMVELSCPIVKSSIFPISRVHLGVV